MNKINQLKENTLEIKELLKECLESSLREKALKNIDNILKLLGEIK